MRSSLTATASDAGGLASRCLWIANALSNGAARALRLMRDKDLMSSVASATRQPHHQPLSQPAFYTPAIPRETVRDSPPKALILSQSSSRLTLYSCSVSVKYCPYSRSIISLAPYLTSSSQQRTCIDRRRMDLDVGVERWNRTESKSTNVWSSPDGLRAAPCQLRARTCVVIPWELGRREGHDGDGGAHLSSVVSLAVSTSEMMRLALSSMSIVGGTGGRRG